MGYCYFRFWPGARVQPTNYSGDLELYGDAQNVYDLLSGSTSLTGISLFANNSGLSYNKFSLFLDNFAACCHNICNNIVNNTPLVMLSLQNKSDYDTYFAGKRFTFLFHLQSLTSPILRYDISFIPLSDNEWEANTIPDCNLSILNYDCSKEDTELAVDNQVSELKQMYNDASTTAQKNAVVYGLFLGSNQSTGYNGICNPSSECDDLRSSSSTSEFLITLNGSNEFDSQESRSYNLLIQPDLQHTSGSISLNNTDELYSGFKQFFGGSCRMLDTVCCHDVGYIDIYGQVVVNGLYWTTVDLGLDDINIPHIANLNQSDVLLLRARFDDECCCFATGYTDEVEDLLNNYFGSSDLASAAKEQLQSFVIPTRIEWHGFARLTDFCCDDSDCAEIPSHEVDINYPPDGSGGGGDNVDITCICDGLTALTSALSGKLDSLIEGQGIIAEAIEGLEVNLDSECICDNLEGIKDSIDDLELSVTNSPEITVSPCQPIVTNPVNNITVTPSTAQITNPVTVSPCQPNITVTPCEPNITINPSAINIDLSGVESAISSLGSTIEDGNDNLVCDDESLACILKNALNTTVQSSEGDISNKSITDVIKDKDLVCENETIIEPVDFTYTRRFNLDSGEFD